MSAETFLQGAAAAARAPTPLHVVRAIAQREVRIALRRRLVKLLFLGSLVPPLVFAVILVMRILARETGLNLGWDPVARFIEVQAAPVLFLALAIGAPGVARDRREDVLFLYATRPVSPWSYTLGKMAAVALPALALLFVPGTLVSILRLGLLQEVGSLESAVLVGKVLLVAIFAALGYAGLTVGASAATTKARWALLTAFAGLVIPRMASEVLWRGDVALDVSDAVRQLIRGLFDGPTDGSAAGAVIVMLGWTALGALVTAARVRREMIP